MACACPDLVQLVLRVVVMLCIIGTSIASIMLLHIVEKYILPLRKFTSAAKTCIALMCIAALYELILIIGAFINIPVINIRNRIIFILDVIATLIVSVLFGVAGILVAYSTSKLSKLEFIDKLWRKPNISNTHDLLAAIVGTSLIGALFMALLVVWQIHSLFKNCCWKMQPKYERLTIRTRLLP